MFKLYNKTIKATLGSETPEWLILNTSKLSKTVINKNCINLALKKNKKLKSK